METVGKIVCKVNTPFAELPRYTGEDGQAWRVINFQLQIKISSASLEFAACYDGQPQEALKVSAPFGDVGRESFSSQ